MAIFGRMMREILSEGQHLTGTQIKLCQLGKDLGETPSGDNIQRFEMAADLPDQSRTRRTGLQEQSKRETRSETRTKAESHGACGKNAEGLCINFLWPSK